MISIIRTIIHYGLHFLAPGLIAKIHSPKETKKVWFVLCLTNLVDLDHLMATPIFDPNRMSIGYHPLHSYWAISLYALLLIFKKSRLIAIGLLFHMFTDAVDYLFLKLMTNQ